MTWLENLEFEKNLPVNLRFLPGPLAWWLALFWMLCSCVGAMGQTNTTFTFTLDEPCKTSAGVYLPDGTLVRTLWSKVRYYSAGTYTSNWDGLDDSGNAVAPGVYQIRLLENNVEYVRDGAIGNTSAALSGPTVHSAFYTMHDLAIAGTNAFYVTGYNEGKYDFAAFSTADPQTVFQRWNANGTGNGADIYDRSWDFAAADADRVYFATPVSSNPTNTTMNNYPGFVVATQYGNKAATAFLNGVAITNGGYSYPNGVYVGTQAGLSGMAVQLNSNLLAVSVAPDNAIYLLDKTSGALVSSFSVANPGRLSFDTNGDLWVVSGTSVSCYTNVNSSPALALKVTGFTRPLAVAVSPTNANLILVADGGSSQQIKAIDRTGASLWTYGMAGGYQANGPAVTTNKFWFSWDMEMTPMTFLTFQPDGTFWVGDGGNHRVMHFSVPGNYLEQIMYQPHSYATTVDPNNPSRVFNQFLEFNVDYTKPLQQSWALVDNWGANLAGNYITWNEGLWDVTDFTNGRTYGLVANTNYQFAPFEICELTTNGLRFTGDVPELTNLVSEGSSWVSIASDGSIRKAVIGSPMWYEATLNGFDASNNPIYNPDVLLATAPDGPGDPVPRCCSFGNINVPITTNNILISFDQSLNNGYHLGGIKLGTTEWLWKVSPAGDLNGLGNYEISNGVTYAGNTVQAVDRNIIYGYHGEFFRSEGQASQHMHFYDDGLFVGQYGEASPGHSAYEGVVPGFAGNAHCPNLIKTSTGDYYVWDNDESAYGPQRWHLVNTRNIREQAGSGTLGGTITLTNQPVSYPVGVTGQPGNQSVNLSWLPVTNASLYKIYYSLMNGGPYQALVDQTASTNCVIDGLTNGTTYYFAVTAITGGSESIPSEQAAVTPFDTSQTVLDAGSLTEGGQWTPVIDVDSNAPALGYPSYVGNEHLTGMLGLDDLCNYGFGSLMDENVGAKGYALFDWGGPGSNLVQVLPPFTVTVGSGWADNDNLGRQYKICGTENPTEASSPASDGIVGILGAINPTPGYGTLAYGLVANPVGSISLGVADTNFHYLTVISPAIFNNPRQFTLTLTSTNGASANYTVNDNPGLSHTFQFLFRGNVTLTANATGGANATVQAIFLDNATVMAPATNSLPPPTGLEVEPVSN